jgi:hypothetical protein
VGGVVLALILAGIAFIVLRRRFRRARLTFADDDGIDGPASPPTAAPAHWGNVAEPVRPEEEDMPPPGYQRVFPTASETEERVEAQRPRGPAVPAKSRMDNLLGRGARPAAAPSHAREYAPLVPRSTSEKDVSDLTWKGERPSNTLGRGG